MNLGLALSGGGFRATAYHLGVLARLAHEDRLEEVTFLSTLGRQPVSGSSMPSVNSTGPPAVIAEHCTQLAALTACFQVGLLWRCCALAYLPDQGG